MAKQLLKMATANNISDAVKLKAITEALDRGGITVKAEVEVTAKPYENIFDMIEMESSSRKEHRLGLIVWVDCERGACPADKPDSDGAFQPDVGGVVPEPAIERPSPFASPVCGHLRQLRPVSSAVVVCPLDECST